MTYSNGFWSADDPIWFEKDVKIMEEAKKMAENSENSENMQKKQGKYPDFKGKDGSAAWLNNGSHGEYLSVVLADKSRIVLFSTKEMEVKGQ